MTPTNTGRHCAACAKVVVDFTLKTDAEILAYLAKAASGRTCGRFAAGQLDRPLQRAAPATPTARWRAWLGAAVAVWGMREAEGITATAQAPTEWRARYWGGPVPATAPVELKGASSAEEIESTAKQITKDRLSLHYNAAPVHLETAVNPTLVLRGTVKDASTSEALPGVTILIKETTIGTNSNADGTFELAIPTQLGGATEVIVVVRSIGYLTQERVVAANAIGIAQQFVLRVETMGQLELRPLPWHPRAFYYWGKYWLTRPFRRS
ncbi:carboxypeptidase-like regulatory domain-containing protein [Hymenobacter rubidus]|uniref:carboxypeptidase-like regulatory domain-containing protein n=1 Tax=Hymenobacter rubidus TaxID=1441626 RepID=UPI00191DE700|nr:carboxypeptidase-like regulatory domain-containing protein [Hymenobacter rubidus]